MKKKKSKTPVVLGDKYEVCILSDDRDQERLFHKNAGIYDEQDLPQPGYVWVIRDIESNYTEYCQGFTKTIYQEMKNTLKDSFAYFFQIKIIDKEATDIVKRLKSQMDEV
jgi:hypothetical protein